MILNLHRIAIQANGGKPSKGLYDRLRWTFKGMPDQLTAQELATVIKIINKAALDAKANMKSLNR